MYVSLQLSSAPLLPQQIGVLLLACFKQLHHLATQLVLSIKMQGVGTFWDSGYMRVWLRVRAGMRVIKTGMGYPGGPCHLLVITARRRRGLNKWHVPLRVRGGVNALTFHGMETVFITRSLASISHSSYVVRRRRRRTRDRRKRRKNWRGGRCGLPFICGQSVWTRDMEPVAGSRSLVVEVSRHRRR